MFLHAFYSAYFYSVVQPYFAIMFLTDLMNGYVNGFADDFVRVSGVMLLVVG
ncbi:hypothetical protein ID856_14890 [Xenorhabdus sp. 18]|uniref:hypothetical protein n=1 Tax=Xenorhabdus doucetiae TaxID=351671 RepID=UPI0019A8022E|nr:hypothetical protein [Xenorhabdus sp. 18]MBD2797811.1 hypothetical protein [Xenorhabdus sp. 18]